MIGTILTALTVYAAIGACITIALIGVRGRQALQDHVAKYPVGTNQDVYCILTAVAVVFIGMFIWPSFVWGALKGLKL